MSRKIFLTLNSLRRSQHSFQLSSLAKNSRGFSIIEALVAMGLMAVLGLGMATLISNQYKEARALEEKMTLQGLQTQITNVLSSPTFCGCFMGATTFNYSATPKNWNAPFPTSISSSYDGACAATGGALLAVGTNISAQLLPTAMIMQNITETTAGSGNFSANLDIQFDQTLLTRSRKSLTVPIYFSVNLIAGTPAARQLNSCASSNSGAAPIDLVTLCGQINGHFNGTTCEPTYQ